MTTLGAPAQVYDPDNQPYAWFTMPGLLWTLGLLIAFLTLALVAIGALADLLRKTLRRVRQLEQATVAKPQRPRPTPHPREAVTADAGSGRHRHPEED